jgi:hypothetical protein
MSCSRSLFNLAIDDVGKNIEIDVIRITGGSHYARL